MSNSNGEEHVSLYFLIFSVLLAFVLILSKILHNTPKINTFVSEAALILIVGMMAGCLIHLLFRGGEASDNAEDLDIATTLLSFTPKVFYMALLPPILFYSGYQFRRELFFRHIQPIFLFSCVGTTITALTTAMVLFGVLNLGWMGEFTPSLSELLAFGSLIAATDTVSVLAIFQAKQVDPHLFYLVFGESALNDAVAIVLFRTFSDMGSAATVTSSLARLPLDLIIQGVGSPLVGMVSGIGVALIFNHIDLRDFQMLELSLYMLLMCKNLV
jgi:sodium/hydrogen exchanger 8